MFIIWGTKTRYDQVGVVADWCESCRKVRAFSIKDYLDVPHLYFIPLGRWRKVETFRQCWECGARYYCSERQYDCLLTVHEAEDLSLSEMIRETNPDLEDFVNARRRPALESLPPAREQSTSASDMSPAAYVIPVSLRDSVTRDLDSGMSVQAVSASFSTQALIRNLWPPYFIRRLEELALFVDLAG